MDSRRAGTALAPVLLLAVPVVTQQKLPETLKIAAVLSTTDHGAASWRLLQLEPAVAATPSGDDASICLVLRDGPPQDSPGG